MSKNKKDLDKELTHGQNLNVFDPKKSVYNQKFKIYFRKIETY